MIKGKIKVKPPSPKMVKLLKEIHDVTCRPGLIIPKKTERVWVEDIDGNKYLDFVSGGFVTNVGRRHPAIVEACKKQLDEVMVGFTEARLRLIKKLAEITPGNFTKNMYFGFSGSASIDCAMQLIRWSTRRYYIIAFIGAYHGVTYGALSLTSIILKRNCYPLIPGIIHVPYAYCYRCPFKLKYPECRLQCVKYIEDHVFKTICPPKDVAGIVIEPIEGDAGWIVPPDDYLPEIRSLSEEYDIPLVVDEVQTGFGRTGKMFACEHWKIKPDVICLGKAMGSGIPISVCIAKRTLCESDGDEFSSTRPYGFTLGGNPLGSIAALTTIDTIEREDLTKNAARTGEHVLKRLDEMKQKYAIIGDIRGKGLLIGVEIVKNRETKEPGVKEVSKILQKAYENGLLLPSLGLYNSTIGICPPLVINREEVDRGLDILDEVMKMATA